MITKTSQILLSVAHGQTDPCLELTIPADVYVGSDANLTCQLGAFATYPYFLHWYFKNTTNPGPYGVEVYAFRYDDENGEAVPGFRDKVEGNYNGREQTHTLTVKDINIGDEDLWNCVVIDLGYFCHMPIERSNLLIVKGIISHLHLLCFQKM